MLIAAGSYEPVKLGLGAVRKFLGTKLGLVSDSDFKFAWIEEFPLMEYDEENKKWAARHHPFCMPDPRDIDLLETNPHAVRALAYDLVCNGFELGGGSIRIHIPEIQTPAGGFVSNACGPRKWDDDGRT